MVESSLLDRVQYSSKGVPLFVEVFVNPELSPILVSSTKGLLWVSDQKGRVRSAFRKNPSTVFSEVVSMAFHTGIDNGWGNSSDLSLEGVQDAMKFFNHYEIPGSYLAFKSKSVPNTYLKGLTVVEVDWLQEGCVVLVPEDRSYLGTLISHVDGGQPSSYFSFVVHNLSRGLYILNNGMA